jgi:hypothetical protein
MLQRQINGEITHPLATAQHLIWLAKRDVKLGLVDDEIFEMRKRKHDKVKPVFFIRRLFFLEKISKSLKL